MASKGLTDRHFCASVQRTRSRSGLLRRRADRAGAGAGAGHGERARLAAGVTALQTGRGKRGWKLLIPKERFVGVPPPRVFCKKRLDLLDSKGLDFFGSAKEAAIA